MKMHSTPYKQQHYSSMFSNKEQSEFVVEDGTATIKLLAGTDKILYKGGVRQEDFISLFALCLQDFIQETRLEERRG